MNCSREQRRVSKYLKHHNVSVNSNPGSGKTTTALCIARSYPNQNILLITYSAHLKSETREKFRVQGIHNIEAHSYHSFFRNYYFESCSTDFDIEQCLSEEMENTPFHYDIIIIDECQDMTPLYFESVCRIIHDNRHPQTRLCVLGDDLQNIYSFKDADSRFLTMAKEIYPNTSKKWKSTTLQMSYRLTDEIADFINRAMYNNTRTYPILACKSRNKPSYHLVDSRKSDIVNIVLSLLERYTPGDIFILAASLRRTNSLVKVLENSLKMARPDVALFIPDAEDESLNEKIMMHKLVFATYHQSKGRERPVTIVLNFDASYTTYYNRDPIYQTKCPNELNVACSRSTEELILIHDRKYGVLPFLNQAEMKECVHLFNCGDDANQIVTETKESKGEFVKQVKCTDLIRFLSADFWTLLRNTVRVERHRLGKKLDFRSTATFNHYGIEIEESVSNLVGITIPLIFEYKKTKQSRCYATLKHRGFLDSKKQYLRNHKKFPPTLDKFKISHWLALANIWNHYLSKYYHKLYQINDYSFGDKRFVRKCLERLDSLNISDTVEFEDNFTLSQTKELPNTMLSCSLDCVDYFNNSIYEFKCVDKITMDHILQVTVYMYAYAQRDTESTFPVKKGCEERKWFIYNMRTDELLQIRFDRPSVIRDIVQALYKDRNDRKPFTRTSDQEFLDLCKSKCEFNSDILVGIEKK